MKTLFATPKTDYKDVDSLTKYKVLWRMGCFLLVTLSIIISINLILYQDYPILPHIIGGTIVLLAMITMKLTKRYEVISMIASLGFTAVLTSILFLERDFIHFESPMWITMNLLFNFYILGRIWGIFTLFISVTAILLYFGFFLEENLEHVTAEKGLNFVNFAIEYIICGTGIAYFLYNFLGLYKESIKDLAITNRKLVKESLKLSKTNKKISSQNKEKEVMLEEIHHRVKNNLQLTISLLRLQSRSEQPLSTSEVYNSTISRVMTMAMIHDGMYQNNFFNGLQLDSFFSNVTHQLYPEFLTPGNFQLNIKSSLDELNSKTLVPLSLLFNELIGTAVKEQRNLKQKLEINISFTPQVQNTFQFEFVDNHDEGYIFNNPFSLEIIDLMVDQLDGSTERFFVDGKNISRFNLKLITDNSLNI